MIIAIDAGHGGDDPGAVNEMLGLQEKYITLLVAQRVREILQSRGHDVIMTREDDVFISLEDRTEIANTAGVNLFLSIHCNAATDLAAEGIETFHYENSLLGEELAVAVQGEMMKAFPDHRNRGVKSANYYVLKYTSMTACLAELEFISNLDQANFLSDEGNQELIAWALADGIKNYIA